MNRGSNIVYQNGSHAYGIPFDPRTKIILLLELDILLFMGRSFIYEAGIFMFCALILLLGGQSKTSCKCMAAFILFVITEHIIAPYLLNPWMSFIHFIVVVVRKVMPAFMLAKWVVATTDVSTFVAAMWKCRFPQSAVITTSVIFRCFPTICEEWNAIQTAMKMRGIEFCLKNIISRPTETTVHMLVPLFISALNISDELAAAALCRGLDNPGEHTCMTEISFRWCDIVFLGVTSVALAVMVILNIRGYSL